jgi:hypothetical protein
MYDNDTGADRTVGPPRERVVYLNDAHRAAEHTFFWAIVQAMMNLEPGGYDDLPDWMSEFATDLLMEN